MFYKLIYRSKRSKARIGEIKTPHGTIQTPVFVPTATRGTVKTLLPFLLENIKVKIAFVNTYHLVSHPGVEVIEKAGGIHKFARLDIPLMSDSGGFQVFSLAKEKRRANIRGEEQPLLVKISDEGVKFRSPFDGKLIDFTPEKSIEYQKRIGADINVAFDECIPYGASYRYSKKATERTHRWLKRSIAYHRSQTKNQYLYGVIQGGVFEDLRRESAQFVVAQDTPGVAIGGVSVGETKKEMRNQVRWVSDYLPDDRPVHLLGVGQFDDIFDLIKYGIDSFDCVEPTRLARMGKIYQTPIIKNQKGVLAVTDEQVDITKTIYKANLEPVDVKCNCYVCANFTKAYLHHLFKQKEILAYILASYHNLSVMGDFFEKIKKLITRDLI